MKPSNSGISANEFVNKDAIFTVKEITDQPESVVYDSCNGIIDVLENSFNNIPSQISNIIKVIQQKKIATRNLENIRIVHSSYVLSEIWKTGLNDHQIQSTNIYASTVNNTYNFSNEHSYTMKHSASKSTEASIAKWNLRNKYNKAVAKGIYFYHIKSNLREKTNAFFCDLLRKISLNFFF